MRNFTRKVALAALIAIALPAAFAFGQLFGNFPQVGGPAYDSGSGVMVPAGPTALTGNETVPADTNLSQGRQPQTVKVPVQLLGAGPTQFAVPVTTDSITVTAQTRRLIIQPAGTIAAFTLVFPTAADLANYDNKVFGFCTTQIVTTLTTTAGAGTTLLNAPTAMLVPVATGGASCVEWVYRKSNTSWYRIQ